MAALSAVAAVAAVATVVDVAGVVGVAAVAAAVSVSADVAVVSTSQDILRRPAENFPFQLRWSELVQFYIWFVLLHFFPKHKPLTVNYFCEPLQILNFN